MAPACSMTANATRFFSKQPGRRLCDVLSEDLVDVSHERPDEPAGTWPGTLCEAESFGVLYVLEGSALGAHVLAKRAAAIGMTPCFGARHLAHQISQPHAWMAFIDLLTQIPMTPSDEELCVAAALVTFERYQRAFEYMALAL
jgi:heme oxygenase